MRIRIAIAVLAGLYPAVFFLSNNWHIFSLAQNLILLAGASIFSLFVVILPTLLLEGAVRFSRGKANRGQDGSSVRSSLLNPALAAFSVLLSVYLLRNTLDGIDIPKVLLCAIIFSVVAYFGWSSHKDGLKPLFGFFLVFSSLAALSLVFELHMGTNAPIESWAAKNKAVYEKIKFRKTPNVYLVIAESYPSKPALLQINNFDNSPFYSRMERLGMKINHGHFSNYHHTLASLPSLFAMEHHFGSINIGNFESVGGRRMMEAKTCNPVIDIFKANNYKIQFLHDSAILMPNGAAVDFCLPSPSLFHGLTVFLTGQDLTKSTFLESRKEASFVAIKKRIEESIVEKVPYFSFVYLDVPGHSPSRLKKGSKEEVNQQLREFRRGYGGIVESANLVLADLVEFIVGKDPESIIIMVGDHGSWGFRPDEDREGKTLPNSLFILDRFGVFAGIRALGPLSDALEKGAIRSHVNLFRYVFAYLSEDEKILETKASDDAYWSDSYMAIKDGEILENFLKVEPRKAGE